MVDRRKRSKSVIVIVLIVLFLGALGAAGYFYYQTVQLRNNPDTAKQAADQQAKDLKAKVAKLITVPDETPTIATVEDKEKLKDQPFFKDAENGDRILIFTQAKKAVIYREKDNRLINVGPIAVTSDATTKTAVSILSSKGTDSATATEGKLSSIASSLTVTKGTAATTYAKTKVYDVSGRQSDLATKLASLTGGDVVTALPAGETVPEGAQIVVFVAQ